MWVRGLKPKYQKPKQGDAQVAPRVGAWIETRAPLAAMGLLTSHLVWVRGLKQFSAWYVWQHILSHPVWVRGLKRTPNIYFSHAK